MRLLTSNDNLVVSAIPWAQSKPHMLAVLFAFVALLSPEAVAGKYNQVLDINDLAPEWKQLKGVDGKSHSSGDHLGAVATIVVFSCNSCPYATDVESRLIAMAKEFKGKGVKLVAINANTIASDSLEAMRQRAKEKSFNFPYLHDETQQVAKSFGAFYTPEFFVLNKKRQVVYMGAMDNSPDGTKVTIRFVAEAVEALLDGKQPSITETVPIGCKIRYQRKRRTRSANTSKE